MPRGPDRPWRRRKEPQTHAHVMASVQRGFSDTDRGFYTELVYTGIETEERASEVRRSLFRCAKGLGYSMRAEIETAADGTFQVRYHAIDKTKARAWMVKTYGADRSKWPYNPRARVRKEQ